MSHTGRYKKLHTTIQVCVNQITFCTVNSKPSIMQSCWELIYFKTLAATARIKTKMMINIEFQTTERCFFLHKIAPFIYNSDPFGFFALLYKIYFTTNLPIISDWWIPIHRKVFLWENSLYMINRNDKWAVNVVKTRIRTLYLRWPHFADLEHLCYG